MIQSIIYQTVKRFVFYRKWIEVERCCRAGVFMKFLRLERQAI